MKVNFSFKESDFNSFRDFEKAFKKQFPNAYVGTDSFALYFEYPKELKQMLRPFPEKIQLEFECFDSRPDTK